MPVLWPGSRACAPSAVTCGLLASAAIVPVTGVGLGRPEREPAAAPLAQLPGNPDGARLEVDIGAAKPRKLTPAQAAENAEQDQGAVPATYRIGQGVDLRHRQAAPLRGAGSGAPRAGLCRWAARPARPRRTSLRLLISGVTTAAPVGFGACEELAADQATARRATRIEARPFGQVIWLQLSGGQISFRCTAGCRIPGRRELHRGEGSDVGRVAVGTQRALQSGRARRTWLQVTRADHDCGQARLAFRAGGLADSGAHPIVSATGIEGQHVLSVTVAIEAGEDYRFLPGFRGRAGLGRHVSILHARMTQIKACDDHSRRRHGDCPRHRDNATVGIPVTYRLPSACGHACGRLRCRIVLYLDQARRLHARGRGPSWRMWTAGSSTSAGSVPKTPYGEVPWSNHSRSQRD